MKKIININFHGRVVPIEETAYDILKQYVESLRKYFANEEGKDEIINDIENRFAELFSERLQKGATCITDEDVNAIIGSMGRPEDFDREEIGTNGNGPGSAGPRQESQSRSQSYAGDYPRQLFRSENDKILGGVCAGLGNYFRVDPNIVRLLYVVMTLGSFGLGVLLYFVLWIALPPKSLVQTARKRLYRNPENRVFGGVASGLAAYFHIEVWVPRLIFGLPLIAGILTSIFHRPWFDMDPSPVFFTGGFGGTLFITYFILWFVLPEANTASEKLEMRGEKVDLESIKNTIKSDIEGFKEKAERMGSEVKDKAHQFSKDFSQGAQRMASEAAPVARRTGAGIGHAIGILFKAFFLFIAGMICIALIGMLVGLLVTGAGVLPFSHYLLTGFWQHFFGWATLILFISVPIVGLLTWLIRRIIGARSRNHYLGYVFGTLWTLGWISMIIFVGMMANNFRTRSSVEDEVNLIQPSTGKVIIRVEEEKVSYSGSDWFGFDMHNPEIFYSLNQDSMIMTNIRVNLVKSQDSAYHVHRLRFSCGNSPGMAKDLASRIRFPVRQADSTLFLPAGFAVTPDEKFRNQQVLVVVEIPVGKRILIDRDVDDYRWFTIRFNRRRSHWNWEFDDDWNSNYSWSTNVEYIMTNDGLKDVNNNDGEEDQDKVKEKKPGGNEYRYRKNSDSVPGKTKKVSPDRKPRQEANDSSSHAVSGSPAETEENYSTLVMHSSFFM